MATRKKKSATRALKKADFDDMESVAAEMAHVLDVPVEDINIKEASNYGGFINDTIYEIDFGGTKEFYVVRDSDAEEALALAIVKQDLESEPELFNQSFIESMIDTDKLRSELMSDVENMAREDLDEEVKNGRPRDIERILEEADNEGINVEKYRNVDGDLVAPDDGEIDDSILDSLAETRAKDRLRDPMEYLEDIYGKGEDAVKQAITIAGIDIDKAAQQAIRDDGAEHFLSSYDGTTSETPSGMVWWRTN